MSNNVDNVCLTSARDLPHSTGDLFTRWYRFCKKEVIAPIPFVSEMKKNGTDIEDDSETEDEYQSLTKKEKNLVKWNMFIVSGNLFSDGYISGSISTMNTCLKKIYGKQYTDSSAISNVSSIAFAGICFGQLFFAFYALYFSRKSGLLLANGLMVIFSILAAGAWTTNSTNSYAGGLFNLITAYRFILGAAIGAEYPLGNSMGSDCASVLPQGHRGRWFVFFTNLNGSIGWVLSSIIPLILIAICGEDHLQLVWRISAGLGAVAPALFFIARWKLSDTKRYTKQKFDKKHIPYLLMFKFYWFRFFLLAGMWFAYDFSSYGFGTYSSIILSDIAPHMSLKANFGWNTLFNFMDVVGCVFGAYLTDYWGPRITGSFGAVSQAIIGFAMASNLEALKKNTTAFVACYCLFGAAGTVGFGNNIGYMCANSTSSNSKMLMFAFCAVAGKIGAFVATYIFPGLMARHGGQDSVSGLQQPYWVACSLALAVTLIFFILFPNIDQGSIEKEDAVFHRYLVSKGFDVTTLGEKQGSKENHEFEEHKEYKQDNISENDVFVRKTETGKMDVIEITESL